MKPATRKLLNFLFLFFTLGVVLYLGLSGNDLEDLAQALKTFSPVYLLLCTACWMVYVLMDALSVHCFLRRQGHPIRLRDSIHAAIVGLYYCNITPGASGGQPMEMYCLSKKNVPIGVSGSALAVKFVCFQIILLITGAVLWLTGAEFVSNHTQGVVWLIVLGYVFNFFSISGVILMAINRKAVLWVIDKCINIGVKLRICKDPEASRQRWTDHCESFLGSFRMLLRTPKDLLIQCAIAFSELMVQMLIILCIYHAMGFSGPTPMELITIGVLLYISASYTPLPGASGAQEGGFALFFKNIFPDASLFVALLIWRFFTYYLTILVGAVVTTVESLHGIWKK
ncbi:MAG: flippase-like domain-containing protein [Clostridiales bacterium]|nr:flippase-like domain-containing protein [Clostridiales bacterium]